MNSLFNEFFRDFWHRFLGQIFDQVFDQIFDQIFGQGFDQGFGDRKYSVQYYWDRKYSVQFYRDRGKYYLLFTTRNPKIPNSILGTIKYYLNIARDSLFVESQGYPAGATRLTIRNPKKSQTLFPVL